eukprot:13569292-Alexandrium_andersonii.AAC.1
MRKTGGPRDPARTEGAQARARVSLALGIHGHRWPGAPAVANGRGQHDAARGWNPQRTAARTNIACVPPVRHDHMVA